MHITSNLEPKLERLYVKRSHLRYLHVVVVCVCVAMCREQMGSEIRADGAVVETCLSQRYTGRLASIAQLECVQSCFIACSRYQRPSHSIVHA